MHTFSIFSEQIRAVNVGLDGFTEDLQRQGMPVTPLQWKPAAGGDEELLGLLSGLDPEKTAAANREAIDRITRGTAVLTGLKVARDAIPGMADHEFVLLHAGPPVTWEKMCGPMKGAMIGSILYEGWAKTPEEAFRLADRGKIRFSPCHAHRAIGPMAGMISPSMRVQVVENTAFGLETYVTLYMGLGRVLRHGVYEPDVLEKLAWLNGEFADLYKAALERSGGIDIKALVAQGLQMGDECHSRFKSTSLVLQSQILPHLIRSGEAGAVIRAATHMEAASSFPLSAVMAAFKGILDPANGIPHSTIVTTIARNGVETGIKVSGAGDTWFTAPAPMIEGIYFPGYGPEDANPDIGDSAITETMGIGSMAMASGPAVVQFIGSTAQYAMESTLMMYEITDSEHPLFKIPALDFRGTPFGIDLRKVIATTITPLINTGIPCKRPNVGQIGAGITAVPYACFARALKHLARILHEGQNPG